MAKSRRRTWFTRTESDEEVARRLDAVEARVRRLEMGAAFAASAWATAASPAGPTSDREA